MRERNGMSPRSILKPMCCFLLKGHAAAKERRNNSAITTHQQHLESDSALQQIRMVGGTECIICPFAIPTTMCRNCGCQQNHGHCISRLQSSSLPRSTTRTQKRRLKTQDSVTHETNRCQHVSTAVLRRQDLRQARQC